MDPTMMPTPPMASRPWATTVEVTPADVSLFQKVYAEPLLALRYYEELLVLSRVDGQDGMAAGVGLGENTAAAIVTRGLAEIMRLGIALGAKGATLAGLAAARANKADA